MLIRYVLSTVCSFSATYSEILVFECLPKYFQNKHLFIVVFHHGGEFVMLNNGVTIYRGGVSTLVSDLHLDQFIMLIIHGLVTGWVWFFLCSQGLVPFIFALMVVKRVSLMVVDPLLDLMAVI